MTPKVDLSKMLNARGTWIIHFRSANEPEIDNAELKNIGERMTINRQYEDAKHVIERRVKELPAIKSSNFIFGMLVGAVIAWVVDIIFIR